MRSNNFELSPDRSSFVIRCDYPVQEYKESGRIEVVVSYLFSPSVAGPLHRHRLKMNYCLKFCISSRCLICLSSSPLLMRPIVHLQESFAEFPLTLLRIPPHAGSVILDCILSLYSGFIDDNLALHVPFCDPSTL